MDTARETGVSYPSMSTIDTMTVSREAKEKLIAFFADHPAWVEAARPLPDGVCSRLRFAGDDQVWSLIRRGGRSVLEPGEPPNPDLDFVFSEGAIAYMTELDDATIGDFATRLYECCFLLDESRLVELRVIAGVGQLFRHGYWKIVLKGGWKVLKIARAHGIGTPGDLRRVFGLLRHKNSADVRAAIAALRKE